MFIGIQLLGHSIQVVKLYQGDMHMQNIKQNISIIDCYLKPFEEGWSNLSGITTLTTLFSDFSFFNPSAKATFVKDAQGHKDF